MHSEGTDPLKCVCVGGQSKHQLLEVQINSVHTPLPHSVAGPWQ